MYEFDRDPLAYVENKAGASLPLVSNYAYVNDPAGWPALRANEGRGRDETRAS